MAAGLEVSPRIMHVPTHLDQHIASLALTTLVFTLAKRSSAGSDLACRRGNPGKEVA